ncbi:hypothetical protein EG329_009011 [Mollisiaceae sp. DMI_Dod_QoI]|nr:hypothetical protein EG329_009011 [Helotiales sp. DMI_Dod_QoI]
MKLKLAILLVALQAVSAHVLFTTVFVNDVNQGDGTCVRMPMTPSNATDPVNAIGDVEMACGNGGSTYVSRTCSVGNGAKLSFLFRTTPNGSAIGSIDPSHKGPCAVYMKYVQTPTVNADGDSWFKIWDQGYDTTSSQWCTEKLIANNGLISVTLPNNLAGGYYFVRTELLALQNADKTPPDSQFYVGCAQIFLGPPKTSDGVIPQETVSIPGYLQPDDPSVNFNVYTPNWPYTMLKVGLVPSNAIVTNANWWAVELDSYSTSDGCWNASSLCYNQTTSCYEEAPPTGDEGCRVWEGRCDDIQAACNASIFNGPPNANKQLSLPDNTKYTIPAAANLTSGQVYNSQNQHRHYARFTSS